MADPADLIGSRSFASLVFDSAGLREARLRLGREVLVAARSAVQETARGLELDLERATEAAGLGRLSRAWTTKVYPKTGLAEEPAGVVNLKGKDRTRGAMAAYFRGARIRSRTPGQYLAIPLRAAGPRYYGRGKVPVTPREWERRTGLQLSPAKIKGKLYLVTQGVVGKKTGIVAKKATLRRLQQGREVKRLLIFLLLPEVDVPKRVDFDSVARGTEQRLMMNAERRLREAIARFEAAT